MTDTKKMAHKSHIVACGISTTVLLFFFITGTLLCSECVCADENAWLCFVSPDARVAALAQMKQEGVVLTIVNPLNHDPKTEPVTSGVPLPEGVVKDVSELCLFQEAAIGKGGSEKESTLAACQFTPLCKWPDGSLKWVLLDWQGDVGKSGSATYRLRIGGKNHAPDKSVSVMQGKAGLQIDGGVLRIGIETNKPGLFHSVILDGKQLVFPTNPVNAVLVDASNRTFKTSAPTAVAVEKNGPMAATVLVQGQFVGENGDKIFDGKVGYDLRITAYSGKLHMKLDFTLKNNGYYAYRNEGGKKRQWLYFKSLRIDVPTLSTSGKWTAEVCGREYRLNAPSNSVSAVQWLVYGSTNSRFQDEKVFRDEVDMAAIAGYDNQRADDCIKWLPSTNAAGQQEFMFVEPPTNPYPVLAVAGQTNGYFYVIKEDGKKAGGVGKMPGHAQLSGTDGTRIGMACRHLAENFQRGYELSPGGLSFLMFPAGGYWPRTAEAHTNKTYQLEGGRHKTANLLVWFGQPECSPEEMTKRLDSPLFARAPAAWYRDTGCVLPLAGAGLTSVDKELNEALARYDKMQRAKVNVQFGDPGGDGTQLDLAPDAKVSIPRIWEYCPDVSCGWMNYGDLIWGFGYCSLHYDWPYTMLSQYLRLGDCDMFEIGQVMSQHRYDIDQYHVEDTAPYLGGFQRYEKGEHGHLQRQATKSWELKTAPSHTWARGPLLHWVLTGDRRSLETALENGRAYYRFFYDQCKLGQKDKVPMNEFRTPAWGIENWLALYEYTGEKKYLDWANELFTKTLLAMEKDNGQQGHILKDGQQGAQFLSYMIEPVCRLHHYTGRQDVADFLKRVLDWQREKGTLHGVTRDGRYYALLWVEDWGHAKESDNHVLGPAAASYDFAMCDGYAYLYRLFNRATDLEFARRVFKEGVFYYGHYNGAAPGERTPVGYHYMNTVFVTTPKMQGWTGRYGLTYMSVEESAGKSTQGQ